MLNASSIIEGINQAGDYALRKAYFDLGGTLGEVEYLLYFFLEAIPAIDGLLNSILNPFDCKVSVGGVFCHQTPKVLSISPAPQSRSCELGDILFFVVYNQPSSKNRIGLGNASLVQAKLGDERPSGAQSVLYETTDVFRYKSPGGLSPQERSLRTAINCLWYWNLDDDGSWHYRHAFSVARPRLFLSGWDGFLGRFLFDLFCGILGRGVRRRPRGDGWSQIVHDLLRQTAHQTVTRRSAKIIDGSRISSPSSALAALISDPGLRFTIGDVNAVYASVGYKMESSAPSNQLLPPGDQPPTQGQRPLDRGEDEQADSVTTIILRFSGQR